MGARLMGLTLLHVLSDDGGHGRSSHSCRVNLYQSASESRAGTQQLIQRELGDYDLPTLSSTGELAGGDQHARGVAGAVAGGRRGRGESGEMGK